MAKRAYNLGHYKRASRWLKERAKTGGEGKEGPVVCHILGPTCVRVATVPHHFIALAEGGSEGIENLVPACRPCNLWEGKGTGRRRRLGLAPPERKRVRFSWPEEAVGNAVELKKFTAPPGFSPRRADQPWFFSGSRRPF